MLLPLELLILPFLLFLLVSAIAIDAVFAYFVAAVVAHSVAAAVAISVVGFCCGRQIKPDIFIR